MNSTSLTSTRTKNPGFPALATARLAGALVLLNCPPAQADLEYWNWTELRVPLTAQAPFTHQPVHWRIFSDLRWGLRYPGMGFNFFRTGPLWTVAPWLVVGTQGTSIAVQSSPGVLMQEYRAELEPTLLWRWGDFALSDRNRVEYRWRLTPGMQTGHVRYRNQLRVAYAPPGANWLPFVWNEPLIEFNGEGFAQNRAEAGIGYQFTPGTRFDVGVMWRARAQGSTWEHDAILNAYLYFAPAITPLFETPTCILPPLSRRCLISPEMPRRAKET